ncbi:hypothetical protein SAMN02745824_1703 [Parasphingorhabdus marina DSM 22363]|uniref:Uncharacterized protein n=1 Tax=Parasphingorhabdus marina DSM 22363 TaxID=1123272 RepID=A0A1N6D8S2_9SPHN|nr:hypothetical protein [Parasphingorhabdus marina]SIN67202.1 hypothetical protein SAMN02745824_1703 [Parasphingorhabdus marina DSM 22363]
METNKHNAAILRCEEVLRLKHQYNSERQIWPSENSVIEVMLKRRPELVDAYSELCENLNDRPEALELFFDRLFSIAILWRPEQSAKMRDDRKQIDNLNMVIADKAAEVANLIREREALHEKSEFYSRTHYHICDVIEEAGKDNVLFEHWVKEELEVLTHRFGLKYWPHLGQIIDVIAMDAREAKATPNDQVTAAATSGTRSSRADFFKALLQSLKEAQEYSSLQLPEKFNLTDDTLASLANCALDIGPDDLFDAPYVKRFRQRERERASRTGVL